MAYRYFNTDKKCIITRAQEMANLPKYFVQLNADQMTYFDTHRHASYDEIWYCGNIPVPPQPERTLEDAKMEKIAEIELHDISPDVNGFYLNGNLVWLDRDTRASLKNTIESATLLGRDTLNIWFNDIYVTLPVETAKIMLATLELYATDCYNVTAQHKVDVQSLTSIREVDSYNVANGYPEKLNFDING